VQAHKQQNKPQPNQNSDKRQHAVPAQPQKEQTQQDKKNRGTESGGVAEHVLGKVKGWEARKEVRKEAGKQGSRSMQGGGRVAEAAGPGEAGSGSKERGGNPDSREARKKREEGRGVDKEETKSSPAGSGPDSSAGGKPHRKQHNVRAKEGRGKDGAGAGGVGQSTAGSVPSCVWKKKVTQL